MNFLCWIGVHNRRIKDVSDARSVLVCSRCDTRWRQVRYDWQVIWVKVKEGTDHVD